MTGSMRFSAVIALVLVVGALGRSLLSSDVARAPSDGAAANEKEEHAPTPSPTFDKLMTGRPAPKVSGSDVGGSKDSTTTGVRRGLLVAVTKYDHPTDAYRRLEGPGNDVPLFAEMLIREFGFDKQNIVILSEVEAAKDPAYRPKRENIEREFRRLADESREGDIVVVALGSHGSRQPAPKDLELKYVRPGGMEAIFLPCDIGSWDGKFGAVTNAIAEHELREWTKRITGKNATFWLVNDSCYSTMSLRGDSPDVPRGVAPENLSIPKEAIEQAAKRAAQVRASPLQTKGLDDQSPNFVAIYGAPPGEPAWEGYLAEDGKRHGYLTYTIVKVLSNHRAPLTYRDLVRAVQAEYRETHPSSYATIEGLAADRLVLNHGQPRIRPVRLSYKIDHGRTIDQGRMHGVNAGSIFRVLPTEPGLPPQPTIGFVRVTESFLVTALVEPIEYEADGKSYPAPDESVLLRGMRCIPEYIDFGLLKQRVAIDKSGDKPGVKPALLKRLGNLEADLQRRAHDKTSRVSYQVVGMKENPQWVVQEREAKLVLLPSDAALNASPLPKRTLEFPLPQSDTDAALHKQLGVVARGQNLLRLADKMSNAQRSGADSFDGAASVRLEMVKLHDAKDYVGAPINADGREIVLHPGEFVGWRVKNIRTPPPMGSGEIDVTLLLIHDDFTIDAAYPREAGANENRLKPGESSPVVRASVDSPTVIQEHALVIAVNAAPGPAVDFTAFAEAEENLARGAAAQRGGGNTAFDSALGRALRQALYDSPLGLRGQAVSDLHGSCLEMISWRVDD